MSKDNTNLRLLGSPVNILYRNKKKDEKKNIRNRPHSALQTSGFTPDTYEKYKRPFSADAKEQAANRGFINSLSSQSVEYHNNVSKNVKVVVPPTTELLGESKSFENRNFKYDKDICSNASDYGSEDTFISLGTKIKNKAQLGPKVKNSNQKNYLKYRTLKRGKKQMDKLNGKNDVSAGFSQTLTSSSKEKDMFGSSSLLPYQASLYDSSYIPLNKVEEDILPSHISIGSFGQSEMEQAIDTYSRRLTLTKHQLSLVEEESNQDNDSVPSQKSSLSIEQFSQNIAVPNDDNELLPQSNINLIDRNENGIKKCTQNLVNNSKTYTSFYNDFCTEGTHSYKTNMSSTVINTDTSSKDSGYPDSGDQKSKSHYNYPPSSFKRAKSACEIQDEPKSLGSISTNSDDKCYRNTYPLEKSFQWVEPLNHSRLFYKDFFLKKVGHTPLPPNNSPAKNTDNVSDVIEIADTAKVNNNADQVNYPSYLLNSSTKAYTSKVIEDYKKELEAINNLHELTLKDIKTDAISPTPLNIDCMFEQHSKPNILDKRQLSENTPESCSLIEVPFNNTSNLQNHKRDVSKISTKELIDNYLRVKNDHRGGRLEKNIKKPNKIPSNTTSDIPVVPQHKNSWNNKVKNENVKTSVPINFRNQTHKNLFTMKTPLSARIESVQIDKDIDSWMSLASQSPRIEEVKLISSNETIPEVVTEATADHINSQDIPENPKYNMTVVDKDKSVSKESNSSSSTVNQNVKTKELNPNSTVLDIYSMLKEIESYGEHPVTLATSINVTDTPENKEERSSTPKDNFMEIFEFLEKVEQSANDALSIVTNTTPQNTPKLETLLKLPQTELAQRLVTASLQLEERSCCIALLQESLANHKEQMINKVSNLEKQSLKNIAKVKQECEEAIKRHQSFIDQLINDKKTLNHRIEQLVDERRSLEERWKRSAQTLEERYKLELRNQHDKMAAAHQVARQRWVRQKAEKIKELTVKGLEGELREMAERQQKEVADLKMAHAEQIGRAQAKHAQELEELRRQMEEEREMALVKERQLASSRLEKQILELELTYQEQRTRLVAELRAENERVASGLGEREREQRAQIEKWREEQEKLLEEKRMQLEQEISNQRESIEEQLNQKRVELELKFEQYKKDFEAEQQLVMKKKIADVSAQHKMERDREIEKAIESMEAEAQAGRKELQEALRRNKEQYELELKELGETEQATLRRYQEAQARVRQTEDRCAELEVTISQLESRNKILTEKNTQLESQLAEVRTSCEETWRAKLDAIRQEMEDLKKTHEEQMHQLYAKVKVAVARKDSAIQALTRESAKQQEKITLLEQKLQQQRKDFLKHK